MVISIRSIFQLQLVFILLALVVLPAQAEWFQEGQNKMGTRVFVKLWHENASKAQALLAESMAEFDRIEASMSTYRADSEISQINTRAADGWVPVGEELFSLIERAVAMSESTDGAFDITYDSVGQFYNFRKHQRPSMDQVAESLSSIDYHHLQFNTEAFTIHFSQPGVRINLGGIAKGYAVESVIRMLEEAGVKHALANAGGDTRVLGNRGEDPWIIGVRDPDDEMKFTARLALTDSAISTSGDYEQFFVEDGTRYHHIISPSTGNPASAVRSVTIIGPDATMTDGLSTSVFVMGPEVGIQLIESLPDYEGIIIDKKHHVRYSTGVNSL